MRFPWLPPLAIAALALLAFIAYRRELKAAPKEVAWLAGTEEMRMLPEYQRQLRASRAGAALFVSLGAIFAIAVTVVAGAPIVRHTDHPKLASRDIVLCLDASGSMLPYDGQILRQFDQMVERFEGERISLHMWSAQTVVKFPLTDDYELISEVLHEAADVIDSGYLGPQGDQVLVTEQLHRYLEGVEAPGSDASSLIGDGLATCVLGFDHLDQDRSRTVILATDNEAMGDQIYTLPEAAEFAESQKVELISLNPGDRGPLTAEAEQLKYVTESSGGSFYNLNDPASAADIIADIEAKQLADLGGAPVTTVVDVPQTAMSWALWSLILFLGVAGWRRL